MWCSSSCYCKNNSRWLLKSSHISEAVPQALHSYVRWRTTYYSVWEYRQATRKHVLERSQCSLRTVRWEMMSPSNALCAMISHSGNSEGRRKGQPPPSLTVLVLRAKQSENSLTWSFPYINSSFIYEVFLMLILFPLCLLLCFFITLLEASPTFSSIFSYTLTANPPCCLIPVLLLLLSALIPVSCVL